MHLVLADDLTGAAETAAAGFRHGLRSAVYTGEPSALEPGKWEGVDLLVINTDTRLMSEEKAKHRVMEFIRALDEQPVLYKKIDSLLRGNVMAEIEAILDRPGEWGVALLPQNPTLGRTLSGGIYYADGIPLHESGLAEDPDYPAQTSNVRERLSGDGAPGIELAAPGTELTAAGVVYCCEAETAEEVRWWGEHLPANMQPVGGGDFFRAVMESRVINTGKSVPSPDDKIPDIALYISGSAHPVSKTFFERCADRGIPSVTLPGDVAARADFSSESLQETLRNGLETHPSIVLRVGQPVVPGRKASADILQHLVSIASPILKTADIPHLYLEGGATAAALLKACGWERLKVVKDWGQGAVTLQCEGDAPGNLPLITLKPSSFPWPDALVRFTTFQHT